MKKEVDAIINVEKTEEKAAGAAQGAAAKAGEILGSASKKADEILSEAAQSAKNAREGTIKATIKRLEKEHERILVDAKKEAARIRKMSVGKNALDGIRKKAVGKILGE